MKGKHVNHSETAATPPRTPNQPKTPRGQQALQRLQDSSQDNYWDSPEVGDTLAGDVVAIEEGTTREGARYPILVLDTDDGVVRVRAARKQLRAQLEEKHAKVGDQVALRFDGTKRSAKGRDFYSYSVVVVSGAQS